VTRARALAAWAARRFAPIAVVATIVGVAIALWGQREAIARFDWTLSPGVLAGSIALFALAPVLQGVCFWLILRRLGVPSRLGPALLVWTRSFLVRYAPTGALAFALRVRERGRIAASTPEVWTATAYEQLVALLSGAVACALFFLAAPGHRVPALALAVCALVVAVAVAVRPRFLGERVQRLLARRSLEVPALLRGRALAAVSGLNALGWVATGAAAWLLVRALSGEADPNFFSLTAAYAFAWLLGFLVPFLPGGLGLREATLVALLAPRYGVGVATTLALALRFANTLGEFAAIAAVEAGNQMEHATRKARAAEGANGSR
jgi:uncharacterized membrane protein YbhN (UPF0104 family)